MAARPASPQEKTVRLAIAEFSDAIRLQAGSIPWPIAAASAYSDKGDYEKAIAGYSEAIRSPIRVSWRPTPVGESSTMVRAIYDKAKADFYDTVRRGPTAR